jgi:C-terminal processing protease CtpA/Prc
MKRLSNSSILLYILIAGITVFSGCKKEETIPVVIPQADVVNTFIWNGLHDYYLWNDQVAGLTNSSYTKTDSLNAFLNKFTDPQKLFANLLYKYNEIDKWSFLVADSKTIDDWISGTSKTMGYDFQLVRIDDAGNLLGYVRYIYKNSPAEKAGVKRGDLFLKVNDQQLTLSNYETLLLKTDNYKLGFATITNGSIASNNRSVTMTSVEMQENPINMDTVLVYSNQKIGYLVYNGFISDYDFQLNDVMKKFKDANIDQMVLDLRYNGGGSVQSSIYLASMLYGTDTTKVFAKSQYNTELQKYLQTKYGSSYLNDNFAYALASTTTNASTPINSLHLQKIYIIVSDNTASASELLINGLKPYMDVKVVGINTVGKYVGSMTVRDWDANGRVSTKHTYAMQPIVVKYANSAGVSDFVNGLTPNIVAREFSDNGITTDELTGILPFGDPKEKLLSAVLADITGIPVAAQTVKSAHIGFKKVGNIHDFKPFANEMYVNPIKKNSGIKP